jgi:hypothetical protein
MGMRPVAVIASQLRPATKAKQVAQTNLAKRVLFCDYIGRASVRGGRS